MKSVTRRNVMTYGAGAFLSACGGSGGSSSIITSPPVPPVPVPTSLASVAAAKGMRFGTAFNTGTGSTFNDAQYTALMQAECSAAVAENDHKWGAIRPDATSFTFTGGDALVDFAAANDLFMRGHVLLWEDERFYPTWFSTYDFGANPVQEAERLLTEHITTVAARYVDDITSWDVVNEAIDPSTSQFRSSPFSRQLGGMEAVLDTAFHAARDTLPNAQLVYNDFMGWGTGSGHRDAVLSMLDGMVNRGTPIDALGIQSHIFGGSGDGSNIDEAGWRTFLDNVVDLGLDLVITEFDVNDVNMPADIATRDQNIAEYTERYLGIMFDYPELRDVLCWGLVHRYSWMQNFQPRADGLQKRSTPFDDDYAPTPMYDAILAAFEGAAVRSG